ncbi:MAG: alpha/beta fold hydrolase [Actinomycetaceae bacterium]|nr:alpha/beta fold hydrolase [Actinomycetaceae bacterium]
MSKRGYTVSNSLVSIGDGMRVRVHRYRRDFIDQHDPTFVLVHGIGVSSEYFLKLAEKLVPHGDVVALDLPGFGDTTAPPHPLSIAGFAACVHRIMRFEKVDNPVVLGHSMGAQVVTELAARDPEWVNRILLLGPPVNALERTTMQAAMRFFQSAVHEPFEVSRFAIGAYIESGLKWFMETLPEMIMYPVGVRLADAGVRTVLMRGEHDHIAPLEWLFDLSLAVQSTTGKPAPIIEVAGGAHSVIVAHADEVAAALIDLSTKEPLARKPQPALSEEALADHSDLWSELRAHQVATPPAWKAVPLAVSDYALSALQKVQTEGVRHGLRTDIADTLRLEGGPIAVGIPGIVETSEHLHLAGAALHRAGWDVRFVPALDTMKGPGHLLTRRLENYLVSNNLEDVTIFAHSKGGLIGKAAMGGPEGWRIRGMVSLGTPYTGSPLANFVPRGLGVADLRPDSPYIHDQFEDVRANPRITSIEAKWDQQVPTGSWLPGARLVTANMYGHNNLLASPIAINVLVEEMERYRP